MVFKGVVYWLDDDGYFPASQCLRGFVGTHHSRTDLRRMRQHVRSLAYLFHAGFYSDERFVWSRVTESNAERKRHQHGKDEHPKQSFLLAQKLTDAREGQLNERMSFIHRATFSLSN